jgi:spore germination protein KB
VTQALSRMEILFAIVLIILLFFKITFLYYVTVKAAGYMLKIRKKRSLVQIIGALVIIYSLTIYPSSVEHAASGREITPILWLLFELIIPLITLVVAKIRKLPQKGTMTWQS